MFEIFTNHRKDLYFLDIIPLKKNPIITIEDDMVFT